MTPELLEVLENPTIDEKKKQEIIERVCALEEIPQIMVNFLKMMSHLGNCDMMRRIFDAYYQYWDEQNHIIGVQIILQTSRMRRHAMRQNNCYKRSIQIIK